MQAPLFNWLNSRSVGVLLHPTSLPGSTGIGTLGQQAHAFAELIAQAGIEYWQMCPLGPTGFGDSPYQSFSAFAGNPYLIDLEALVADGLLEDAELAPLRALPQDHVDFGAQWQLRWPLLRLAADRFLADKSRHGTSDSNRNSKPQPQSQPLRTKGGKSDKNGGKPQKSPQQKNATNCCDYLSFCNTQADWLEPYALFSALKLHHGGSCWYTWPQEDRDYARARQNSRKLPDEFQTEVRRQKVLQYWFASQWHALRSHATKHGVQIIGDIPIFVSLDSADVWSRPELYELAANGRPSAVAGVPPDYFSPTGQLWGNPLYRWQAHADENYDWWLQRLGHAFALYDVVRLDHFRGFDTFWRIPARGNDARKGKWIDGPGLAFFEAVARRFPDCRLIAEDLGYLSPSVHALRHACGLPGMAILQFGFGDKDSTYLPHNLQRNCVLYPGTHDNDTSCGWYTATEEKARDHMRRYLGVSGETPSWDLIRCGYASVSNLFIVAMQDFLSLDGSARFNRPGQAEGNWQWRVSTAQLERFRDESTAYLLALKELYRR